MKVISYIEYIDTTVSKTLTEPSILTNGLLPRIPHK
jgi:hypothetical protein